MLDIYELVNDRIIAELENGIIPWELPWVGVTSGAIKHATGKPYSLINQMLLAKPGEYLTFDQCKREGGRVKKGARTKMVVFWKVVRSGETDQDGNPARDERGMPVVRTFPVLRYFNVFHIDDCEGIEPKHSTPVVTAEPVDRAEKLITDYAKRAALDIQHNLQDQAYYSPARHVVSLPLQKQFLDTSLYYSTTFHELAHSTGHKTLLKRFTDSDEAAMFGSESYSKEELVAEIGSCMLMHEIGLATPKSLRNNVAYIQSWLRKLKNDKRFIVSAAGRADKAARLIMGIKDDSSDHE